MTAYTTYQTYYRYSWRFIGAHAAQPVNRTSHRAR